jgi:hypothetical protein
MSERKICTKESPYNPEKKVKGERWQHPDAEFIDSVEDPPYYYSVYKCPICGLKFKVELPQ